MLAGAVWCTRQSSTAGQLASVETLYAVKRTYQHCMAQNGSAWHSHKHDYPFCTVRHWLLAMFCSMCWYPRCSEHGLFICVVCARTVLLLMLAGRRWLTPMTLTSSTLTLLIAPRLVEPPGDQYCMSVQAWWDTHSHAALQTQSDLSCPNKWQ